jgi:PEP-CTERM motif
MNKPFPFLTLLATVLLLAAVHRSEAQLVVQNGDFQNLTGLTDLGGGWYSGVPTGWTGVNTNYTVLNQSGNYVANLNTLTTTSPSFAALYQAVGTLATTGIVTVNFELIPLVSPTGVSAGIFNTQNSASYNDWTVLALPPGFLETAGFQTLSTSVAIDAGTPIGIAFWQGGGLGGAPGMDNVSVVPEPSTYALLGLGAAGLGAHLVRRRRR